MCHFRSSSYSGQREQDLMFLLLIHMWCCTHLTVPYFLSVKLIQSGLSCSVRKRASTSMYQSHLREKRATRNSDRSLRWECVFTCFFCEFTYIFIPAGSLTLRSETNTCRNWHSLLHFMNIVSREQFGFVLRFCFFACLFVPFEPWAFFLLFCVYAYKATTVLVPTFFFPFGLL